MSPADREHRFGHGKAEPLAVLGQSAFITGSALLLLAEAMRRLINPAAVENPPAGIAVMDFRSSLRSRSCSISAMSCAAPGRSRSAPTSCTTAATSF